MSRLLMSPLFNVSLLSLFWAIEIFVAKLAFLAGAEVFTFSLQTLIVTVIFLVIFILPKKLPNLLSIPIKTLGWLLFIGIISTGIGGTLSNAGIQLTTAINAGFLFQVDIALTILIAWLLLKEKLDVTKVIMLIFILGGTYLLTTNGKLLLPHLGDIFILLACICFATTTVFSRKFLKNTTIDPDIATLLRVIAGLTFLLLTVGLIPFLPEVIKPSVSINLLNFNQSFYVVLNSLFVIGTLLFLNRTLKIASASYTAMIASVTPILVAILGTFFLHESLTPIQIVGAFLIASASLVTHLLKVDKH